MKRRRTDRRTRKSVSQIRRSRLERLEDRHLLAAGPWYELTELTTSSSFQAGDGAVGLAASGDTIVVGSRTADGASTTNSGKVYIYDRDNANTPNDPGDDIWSIKQELIPDDLSDGDYFGHSIAMDGDTLVIGAFHPISVCCPTSELGDGMGVAYVYRYNPTSDLWDFEQKLAPDSYGGLNDRFGWSVAVEGNIIAVGAQRYDDETSGLIDRGAVYVFHHDGTGWQQQQRLLASNGDAGDLFGVGLTIDQGEIVVGARNADADTSLTDNGAAYVFSQLQEGVWTETAILQAGDAQSGDIFGRSVTKKADTLLVSAPRADIESVVDAGAVYQFVRVDGQWTQVDKLTPQSGSRTDEQFGREIAMNDDTIVVGTFNGGRGFILERDINGTWQETAELTASDPTDNDGFAVVAVADDFIVGEQSGHDHNGNSSGGAYVFVKDATRNRESFFNNDTPLLLKDGKGRNAGVTTSEITIPESGTIEDIDVQLNISHTRISDLKAELIAPDGTTVTLFENLTDSGDHFNHTFFDDAADTNITDATAPFWGSFRPTGNLGSLNGQVGGTWQLRISDHNKGTTGTLQDWLIVAKYKLPEPSFSIDDVSVTEGDSGATTAQFTVTRSGNVSAAASVDYKTRDGDATAPADYVDITLTTLVFDAGETTKSVAVTINGDTLDEGDEAFYVDLSNASTGAIITKAEGVGTIQNDDAPVASAMFVADISFQSRKGNKEWRAIFDVRDEFGSVVTGASITVTFAGQTYSGQTDGNGQFRSGWLRLSSGSYEAEVTDLALTGYNWDLTQGVSDSADSDPYPDELLTF